MRRAAGMLIVLLLASCGDFDAGVAAYDAGRPEDALEVFRALDAEEEGSAAPEVLHNLALSALAARELGEAEKAATRLAGADDLDDAGMGDFLMGNVAFARAGLAADQARAVEAEPFAFEIAIRHTQTAAEAWGRAASTRDDWPAARRNVERALRLGETLREEQQEAARTRDRKTAGGGGARVRPIPVDTGGPDTGPDGTQTPQPPTPDAGSETEPGEAAGVSDVELTPDQVLGLIERLSAKEREKRDVRQEQRRAAQAGVEKDW